jgi:hypothetical protein
VQGLGRTDDPALAADHPAPGADNAVGGSGAAGVSPPSGGSNPTVAAPAVSRAKLPSGGSAEGPVTPAAGSPNRDGSQGRGPFASGPEVLVEDAAGYVVPGPPRVPSTPSTVLGSRREDMPHEGRPFSGRREFEPDGPGEPTPVLGFAQARASLSPSTSAASAPVPASDQAGCRPAPAADGLAAASPSDVGDRPSQSGETGDTTGVFASLPGPTYATSPPATSPSTVSNDRAGALASGQAYAGRVATSSPGSSPVRWPTLPAAAEGEVAGHSRLVPTSSGRAGGG